MTDWTARRPDDAEPTAASGGRFQTPDAVEHEPVSFNGVGSVSLSELKDKLLRALAEMENQRKRAERQVADARDYAITSFARDVLGVADNMERALAALDAELREKADAGVKALLDGVELTERELLKVLEKHGVKKFEPQGEKFDPHLHQAMFEQPDPSLPAGTVARVIQPGYMIGERVLRPALVAVARGGPKPGGRPTVSERQCRRLSAGPAGRGLRSSEYPAGSALPVRAHQRSLNKLSRSDKIRSVPASLSAADHGHCERAKRYASCPGGEGRYVAQHRSFSNNSHRQPAAAPRPYSDDVCQGGGRAGRASGAGSSMRAAVAEVVGKQVAAGIDVVNDGEMSKPSYATYVKDRLAGFGGTGNTFVYQDLADFPNLAKRVFGDPGRSRRKTPACNAAISVLDANAVAADVDNLKTALAAVERSDAFMTAASPGVVSLFFRNDHYPSHEAYLFAIAEALRSEYETIAKAGMILQIDCPDLAMGRHIQYAGLSLQEFRRQAGMHVAALNHALSNVAPEQLRLHLCWGNYEGPHHYDVPLADILDIVFGARASTISFEAANPRHAHEWRVFESVKLPADKALILGVIELKSNFIEHPELIAQRISRYAKLVGRENVIAGSDCGYGTWVGQAAVDADVVWAKLAALAEGARIASAQHWR